MELSLRILIAAAWLLVSATVAATTPALAVSHAIEHAELRLGGGPADEEPLRDRDPDEGCDLCFSLHQVRLPTLAPAPGLPVPVRLHAGAWVQATPRLPSRGLHASETPRAPPLR